MSLLTFFAGFAISLALNDHKDTQEAMFVGVVCGFAYTSWKDLTRS